MDKPTCAEVELEFRTSDEGGREQPVLLVGGTYRPHLVAASGEYLGVAFVHGPAQAVQPGSYAQATLQFLYAPRISYAELVEGCRFRVMEGGREVASGRVVRILR